MAFLCSKWHTVLWVLLPGAPSWLKTNTTCSCLCEPCIFSRCVLPRYGICSVSLQ